jgi:hypothetical protein
MNFNIIQAFGMLQQIQQNPMSILSQKFNIPDGVNLKDPNEIINHLVTSGQVNQSQIDSIKKSFSPYTK